ncbi:MAG: gluP [Jatrophihabitans sp.]|nr:gluP [Jatrophihabitans sp.]
MRPASVGFHCPDDVALARKTIRPQRTSVGAVLRDSPPYVTASLVAVNVVVYVITGLQSKDGLNDPGSGGQSSLFYKWQLWPPAIVHDDSYWRLATSAFLHLSLLHIASNMLVLAVVGPSVEHVLGRWRFLTLYLVSAIGGSAAVFVFGSTSEATVGASGAIFGLFAAALVMVRRLGLDPQWLIGIIVLNFVFTFSVAGISRWGHIGGFVTGALVAVAIAGLPQATGRVPERRQVIGVAVIVAALVVAIGLRGSLGNFPQLYGA